jgi:hypothetical protein
MYQCINAWIHLLELPPPLKTMFHCGTQCAKLRQNEAAYNSGRILILSDSTTEKWPSQSLLLSKMSTISRIKSFNDPIVMRNNTIPHIEGRCCRNASSPKSLSKVTIIRRSICAFSRIQLSETPGLSKRAHKTSCPRIFSKATASPGKFSSAKIRKLTLPRDEVRHREACRSRTVSRHEYLLFLFLDNFFVYHRSSSLGQAIQGQRPRLSLCHG